MFFYGGQPNGDRRISSRGRLRNLIALADFLSKDAVVHALRFLVGDAVRFHVTLQGGTASAPLRVHGPLVVLLLQLQVVHLIGTALPEIQLRSFGLHFVAPSHVWVLPFVQRGAVHEKQNSFTAGEGDCPSAPSRAPGCGVHWSEAEALDGRSGRIRRRIWPGRMRT